MVGDWSHESLQVDGYTDESLTFNEVIKYSKRIGSYLRKYGVQKKDVVILFLSNNIYYPVLVHAILGIVAITSPCNPLNVPGMCYPLLKYLPTAREGNVCTGICQSFCSQPALWLLSHCSSLLRRGRYASYWNAFLLFKLLERSISEQLLMFKRLILDELFLKILLKSN